MSTIDSLSLQYERVSHNVRNAPKYEKSIN